jgi:phosphocarrier protein
MVEKEIVVSNLYGLHARPASIIVQAASKFSSEITIEKDGAKADAKSIMSVMMLAANRESRIIIRASGDDEADAVDALVRIISSRFNEE